MKRDQDQLAARAEAYLLGELPTAEVEAFEELLRTDQPAREAVAAAVELLATVRASLPTPTSAVQQSQQAWMASFEWIASIAGAGLLAVVVMFGVRAGVDRSAPPTETADGELALIWSDMIEPSESDAGEELPVDLEEFALEVDDNQPLVADSPDWMLAAVVQLSEQNDMDHERDMENR